MTHKTDKANSIIDKRYYLEKFNYDPKVRFKDLTKRLKASGVEEARFHMIKPSVTLKRTNIDGRFLMAFVSDKDNKPYHTPIYDSPNHNTISCIMHEINGFERVVDKSRKIGDKQKSTLPIVLKMLYRNDSDCLIVEGASFDFKTRWHVGAGHGNWKSSSGDIVSIREMNEYHLKNALRKSVRDVENRSKFFELKNEIRRRGISL